MYEVVAYKIMLYRTNLANALNASARLIFISTCAAEGKPFI